MSRVFFSLFVDYARAYIYTDTLRNTRPPVQAPAEPEKFYSKHGYYPGYTIGAPVDNLFRQPFAHLMQVRRSG